MGLQPPGHKRDAHQYTHSGKIHIAFIAPDLAFGGKVECPYPMTATLSSIWVPYTLSHKVQLQLTALQLVSTIA